MDPLSFEDLCAPGLPTHSEEVLAAHNGQPSQEVQDRTHGAGTPAEDRGLTEAEKYGGPA